MNVYGVVRTLANIQQSILSSAPDNVEMPQDALK
jgi:hypothetical protein